MSPLRESFARERNERREGSPSPRTGARRLDATAVMFHHVAHHIETQTQAMVGARAGAVLLAEPLEGEGQELRAHSLAAVGDAQTGLPVDGVQGDFDRASGWSELDRVREEVRDTAC